MAWYFTSTVHCL